MADPFESRRRDPRTETTQAALIEVAERMFAEHGFDSVSIRQVGIAIGSGNKNVVAYHFGSKEGLIEAIFEHRLPAFDVRRHELMAQAERDGKGHDLTTLLTALWLPFLEQTDAEGRHSYARLVGRILRQDIGRIRHIAEAHAPARAQIALRVAALLPDASDHIREVRWQLASNLVLDALRLADGLPGDGDLAEVQRQIFDGAIAMAVAALSAPWPTASAST